MSLRKKANLTQRQLAELAGTSQQQVGRIESGAQVAGLEVAIKIAKALGQPVTEVFPSSKSALARLAKLSRDDQVKQRLHGGEVGKELLEAGLDPDPRQWFVLVGLRDGSQHRFRVSSDERRYLRSETAGNHEGGSHVTFDSDGTRVLLGLRHAQYIYFVYEQNNIVLPEPETEALHEVVVWLDQRVEPMRFDVEADEFDEVGGDGIGQLGHLVFMATREPGLEPNEHLGFIDADGEEVFLLLRDIALMQIPLWVVDKDSFQAYLEDDEEEEPDGAPIVAQ